MFCLPKYQSVTPHPSRFTPAKEARYPLYRRLGGPQGRSGRVRKISPPPGFDSRNAQPVASRYTDYAIPAQCLRPMKHPLYKEKPITWRRWNWDSALWEIYRDSNSNEAWYSTTMSIIPPSVKQPRGKNSPTEWMAWMLHTGKTVSLTNTVHRS